MPPSFDLATILRLTIVFGPIENTVSSRKHLWILNVHLNAVLVVVLFGALLRVFIQIKNIHDYSVPSIASKVKLFCSASFFALLSILLAHPLNLSHAHHQVPELPSPQVLL